MRNVNNGVKTALATPPDKKSSYSNDWLQARLLEAKAWHRAYGPFYKERSSGAVPPNDTWFGTYKEVRRSGVRLFVAGLRGHV